MLMRAKDDISINSVNYQNLVLKKATCIFVCLVILALGLSAFYYSQAANRTTSIFLLRTLVTVNETNYLEKESKVNFSSAYWHSEHSERPIGWKQKLFDLQQALDIVREKFLVSFTTTRKNNCTASCVLDAFQCEHKYKLSLKSLPSDIAAFHEVSWLGSPEDSKTTRVSLPVQHVFKPHASQPVCDNLLGWQQIWRKTISCNELSQISYRNLSEIEEITNNGHELLQNRPQYSNFSESLYSYVALLRNAFINNEGSVTTDGGFTVLPVGCDSTGRNIFMLNREEVSIYEEVFIIAQFWGLTFFHANVENLPRLAPYVEFLQRHPHIRLHVAYGYDNIVNKRTADHINASLSALGLHPDRIVSGAVRARIAYLPRGTPCGYGLMPELQTLSWRFHSYIAAKLNEMEHASVVLIIREVPARRDRNMARAIYTALELQIKSLLLDSPLKLELFDDRHRLGHSDTLRMFYRARIVIGIHGAGLANMIYSRPGTQVIEMLCQPPDNVNLCYANTALILGHRYHAFPVSSCSYGATVDVSQLLKTIAFYVTAILSEFEYKV